MNCRLVRAASLLTFAFWAQAASSAQLATPVGGQTPLAQCVVLRTSGADRLLVARWLFAVMAKSPQIADLSAVTVADTDELNRAFAKLMTRIVTKDCLQEVRPLAVANFEDAFEQVGGALGATAMNELMGTKWVDKAIGAYTEYLSKDAFNPLTDSLPKKAK